MEIFQFCYPPAPCCIQFAVDSTKVPGYTQDYSDGWCIDVNVCGATDGRLGAALSSTCFVLVYLLCFEPSLFDTIQPRGTVTQWLIYWLDVFSTSSSQNDFLNFLLEEQQLCRGYGGDAEGRSEPVEFRGSIIKKAQQRMSNLPQQVEPQLHKNNAHPSSSGLDLPPDRTRTECNRLKGLLGKSLMPTCPLFRTCTPLD